MTLKSAVCNKKILIHKWAFEEIMKFHDNADHDIYKEVRDRECDDDWKMLCKALDCFAGKLRKMR